MAMVYSLNFISCTIVNDKVYKLFNIMTNPQFLDECFGISKLIIRKKLWFVC